MSRRPNTRLLVTGGTGVIGASLLERLPPMLPHGVEVVATVRSRDAANQFESNGIGALVCDLTDLEQLRNAASELPKIDRTVVVHCAADVAWHHRFDEMHPINVNGTRNIATVARETSPTSQIIYVSSAYTSSGPWRYRNAYEETKAMGDRLLRDEFADLRPTTFSCSLVVGQSGNGAITRFHGLYPLFYILDVVRPPALIGERNCRIDVVPLDWVTDELTDLVRHALDDRNTTDVVASIGERAPTVVELLSITIDAMNKCRSKHALPSLEVVPVLPPRQWKFLQSALKSWKVVGVPRAPLKTLQLLMESYEPYVTDDTVLMPTSVTKFAPRVDEYFENVVQYWFDRRSTMNLALV